MTKRYNLAVLIVFSCLILSSSTFLVFSQTINPANFNGSYKVKVGDTVRYNYTKVHNNQGNSINFYSIYYSNGTSLSYNLTQGSSIYIQVTNISKSSSGNPQVLANLDYSFHGKTIINLNKQTPDFFLYPAFDSYTHAKSYFKAFSPSANRTFSKNGDFIEIISNSYNPAISPSGGKSESQLIINWKTGWLQKSYQKSSLSNGTIESETLIQRHSDNTSSTLINYSIGLIELGSIVVVIAIPVFVVFNYKKYASDSEIAKSSESFLQYLRNRFHYTKKSQNRVTGFESDKALETIELILKETTDEGK